MVRERLKKIFPTWQNTLLALVAAGLLILAFPDFERWWTAWFALVPLMWAVDRQKHRVTACFVLGWLFGTAYLFGTCWWLTYAPIHYAAVPWPLAYLMIFVACLLSGLFSGVFAAILARLFRTVGSWAFPAAPFVWVLTEFGRYWFTGNNWNAIGYSQAFSPLILNSTFASAAGVYSVGFFVASCNAGLLRSVLEFKKKVRRANKLGVARGYIPGIVAWAAVVAFCVVSVLYFRHLISGIDLTDRSEGNIRNVVIGVQSNVPMAGLDRSKWETLREKQFSAARAEIDKLPTADRQPSATIVLPESPMNFAYNDDREFQQFIGDFARRNNVSVLFNSAEPDKGTTKYFNSAVMVGPDGKKAAEYDKIYLLPFGEAVPFPFEGLMPAFVGQFAYGRNYTLLPVGDAKAGVMICFESHFGQLSRQYVRDGADALIEMTNDGYLGPTPVLRQHLANAVFRAVETNRPVLRVTNVGITAYIDERGNVHDELPPYTEGTRVWSVSKSDGSQTFYVKYGDWFAWLCTIVTAGLLIISFAKRKHESSAISA